LIRAPATRDELKINRALADVLYMQPDASSPAPFAPLKIYGWSAGHSGCGQYRIGLPMWGLEQAGHDARAFSVLEEDIPEDADVVIGQLLYDEGRNEAWQSLSKRTGRRPVLIAEIDDDLWNIHKTNYDALSLSSPEMLGRLENNLRIADAVTVTTPHLAEVVSRFNPNVVVLPNMIDLNLIMHQRSKAERTTIGWAGGSSHLNDFEPMRGQLGQFLRRHPEVDLHLVGQDYRGLFKVPNTRWTTWNMNLVDYLHTLDFDIGIAPLAYNEFNKSKSDIKVLEYASLGIPVVASDFGPYADNVVHGETGFLVKHSHEWSRYLRMLVEDHQLRETMSVNAKLWASERTIQGNVWRWEMAYRAVIQHVHGGQRAAAVSVS
jgi:glycosyltransferase involved in cell wall biosynthesis